VIQTFQRSQPDRHDGRGVIERSLEVTRIEPDERPARLHALIVGNQHLSHEAADMRRHGHNIAADIRRQAPRTELAKRRE
jgi:hypothetical protein